VQLDVFVVYCSIVLTDEYVFDFWYIFGTLLVHFWYIFGTHFWYTFGTFLVHFWYIFGTLFFHVDLALIDQDGDGDVDIEEVRAYAKMRKELADDGDGEITREELADLEAAGIIGFDPPIGLLPARSSAPLKGTLISFLILFLIFFLISFLRLFLLRIVDSIDSFSPFLDSPGTFFFLGPWTILYFSHLPPDVAGKEFLSSVLRRGGGGGGAKRGGH
jgi:hypothetical protein